MKNDQGFLLCLPSEIAVILVGIGNAVLLIAAIIMLNVELIVVAVITLIPIVWTFFDRETAWVRLIVVLVYIAEAAAV